MVTVGEAIQMGADYGRVMFLGMGFSYCAFSVYTAMRGIANPNMAMSIMLGSTILNVILDPLFIFGYLGFPHMGVIGAAVASVISYALAFATGMALFYNGTTNVKLHFKGRVPMSIGSAYRLLKIGIPAWISSMSFSGGRLLVMPMIAMFGNSVVAAYGVGTQITSLGVMILVGIGLGLASLIGHNLGSLKKDRAKKTGDQAILLAIGIMIVCGLIVFFGAGIIMRLYFDSPETVHNGIVLLRILAVGMPFVGIYIMLEQIYTGVGLNTPAMVVSIGHSWLLEIPAIYILTQILNFSQNAVWWTLTAATAVSSLAFYWYYRRGQWLEVKV